MFTDFWLPIMWDNSWNDNGHLKDNRALAQQLWTPLDGDALNLVLTPLTDTTIQLDWTIGSTNQDGHSI
jgi:hypothetical protein